MSAVLEAFTPEQLQPCAIVRLDAPPTTEQVRALETLLRQCPQVLIQPKTMVHGKVAARAVFIPADTVLTGAETNLDNLAIVFGDITVSTDAGARRITGFDMLPAIKGRKRVGRTHADTWWITVHHTDLTDPTAIEDEMTGEAHLLQSRRYQLGAA